VKTKTVGLEAKWLPYLCRRDMNPTFEAALEIFLSLPEIVM